jgi:hypothetical protein
VCLSSGHVTALWRMSESQLEVRWLLQSESYALLSFLAISCS